MSAYNIDRNKKKTVNPYIKKFGYYFHGENNNYPNEIIEYAEKSHTASSCMDMCKKFIFGAGFGADLSINRFIVNYSDNNTLYDFTKRIINNLILFKEVFVKATYILDQNRNPVIGSLKVLDNKNVRYCYKDDYGYISNIAYSNDFSCVRNREDYTKYYIYNDKTILDDIIKKDKSIEWDENYLTDLNNSGVIFILKDDSIREIYPKPRIYPVIDDCIIEDNASTFKKNGITKGHFGRTILVLPQKVNTDNYSMMGIDTHINKDDFYLKSIEDNEDQEFKKLLGADNIGGMLVYRTSEDDLSKAIQTIKIDTDITPDLFKDTEVTSRENIASVFFNVPVGLIKASDALFGQSGESYRQMKIFLQENTKDERIGVHIFISNILSKMPRFVNQFGVLPEIVPLIQ